MHVWDPFTLLDPKVPRLTHADYITAPFSKSSKEEWVSLFFFNLIPFLSVSLSHPFPLSFLLPCSPFSSLSYILFLFPGNVNALLLQMKLNELMEFEKQTVQLEREHDSKRLCYVHVSVVLKRVSAVMDLVVVNDSFFLGSSSSCRLNKNMQIGRCCRLCS